MEIKPPSTILTPPQRERTLPLEGERRAPTLPVEGELDFAQMLSEELGAVQRAAAQSGSKSQLMEQAKAELEQSARHLMRAHQFLDLAKKGTEPS